MEKEQENFSTTESNIEPYLNVVVKCEFEDNEVKTDIDANKDIACKQCHVNVTPVVNRMLDKHNKETERSNNQCKLCNEQFLNSNYLKQHLTIHVGEAPYECLLCEKTFCRKDRLQIHLWVHCDIQLYKCEDCDKTFAAQKLLARHMQIHSGIKPHACEQCGASFYQKGNLTRHLQRHIGFATCFYLLI